MIVKAILLRPEVALKVTWKHGILQDEISDALVHDRPIFRKAGGNQYLAIGLSRSRHITIFFSYNKRTKEAEITTAYQSSKRQIRVYRKQGR
ncbi:hypothetical protein JW711_01915 [Candidatus Woesearchaeota archaeon]|nr:hypothetical protein [Candidatus Woesearchaeota archaeon]